MAESQEERIRRIAREVMEGKRSLNSVRHSVDRLAGGQTKKAKHSLILGAKGDNEALGGGQKAVEDRVRAIFSNRGVGAGQYKPKGKKKDSVTIGAGRYRVDVPKKPFRRAKNFGSAAARRLQWG